MAKFFQKSRKKLGDQFGSFWLKFGQKYIFVEKRALQFLNIPIIFSAT